MKWINVFVLLTISLLAFGAKITDDLFKIGEPGSSDNKIIKLGDTREIRSNESTGVLEFSNDGSLYLPLGSGGGGGLSTFYTEDFETTVSASDITTGKDATFDDGGSLGGVVADESSSPISGDNSVKYTTNVTPGSSDNDFFYLPAITLDTKQQGNYVGLQFYYTWDGSDDLIEVVIWDDTNNEKLTSPELDLIKNKGSPKQYVTTVYIPDGVTSLKVGFHHTGSSESSKVLTVDDFELRVNPLFNTIQKIDHQIRFSKLGSSLSNALASNPIRWGSIDEEVGSGIISYDDSNGRVTALKDCSLDISYSVRAGTTQRTTIRKNGTDIQQSTGNTNFWHGVPIEINLLEGEYVDIYNEVGNLDTGEIHYASFSATSQESSGIVTAAETSVEVVHFDGIAGYGSTNTKIPYYTNERINQAAYFIEVENDSTNGFSITAKRSTEVSISASGYHTSQLHFGITLQGSELTTDIQSISNVDTRKCISGASGQSVPCSAKVVMSAGQVLRVQTNGVNPAASKDRWSVVATARSSNSNIATLIPVQKEGRIKAAGNGGTSITANTTNLDFTEIEDSLNCFNGSVITMPFNGYISMSGTIASTSSMANVDVYEGGSQARRIAYGTGINEVAFNYRTYLTKDTTVSLRLTGSETLNNDAVKHHLNVYLREAKPEDQ